MSDLLITIIVVSLAISFVVGAFENFVLDIGVWRGLLLEALALPSIYLLGYTSSKLVIGSLASAFIALSTIYVLETRAVRVPNRRL
jgi:hypothetical protein